MDFDDDSSFAEMMKGVKPIKQDKIVAKPQQLPRGAKFVPQKKEKPIVDHYFSDSYQAVFPSGPMRYSANPELSFELKKLRRGDYAPDIFLDLHGLTVANAKFEILALLEECKRKQIYCCCISHGLGKGILKQQVPNYLVQHPDVLAFHQAPLEYGGDGSLLILLNYRPADGKYD